MEKICWLVLIIFVISNNIFAQFMNPPMIPTGNRVDWTVSGLTIQRPTAYNLIIDVTKPPYSFPICLYS